MENAQITLEIGTEGSKTNIITNNYYQSIANYKPILLFYRHN